MKTNESAVRALWLLPASLLYVGLVLFQRSRAMRFGVVALSVAALVGGGLVVAL